jgi:hypothetical protein
MPPADPQHYAHGQYQGYTDTPGVAPGSTTETYGALRLEIENWRWADVPIFIRAGKAPPVNVTEVRLLLHRTSRLSSLPGLPGRRHPTRSSCGEPWTTRFGDALCWRWGEPYLLTHTWAITGERNRYPARPLLARDAA